MDKIKEVVFQSVDSPLGNTGARVVLENEADGSTSEGYLFSWFSHEVHFEPSEFIGLTVLEAHRLRHQKYRRW